jgi:nitronate monooxygenase
LAAALSIGATALSFTFGLLPEDSIRQAKAQGLLLLGTATTVEEARALSRHGADAIIAQGMEAGGHRGTFLRDFSSSLIGTMALVPQIADAVSIPVIASGGIMDGRGIAAALCLGAEAAQMGTAFLTTEEAGVPLCYKDAVLRATEEDLVLTSTFSGRLARGIGNRFTREIEAGAGPILPFPLQNVLTRPIRSAAAKKGDPSLLSLWAGQGLRMARRQSATALVKTLTRQTVEALDRSRALELV